MLPEVVKTRYYQLDPKTTKGLLTYFRLAQGIPEVTNFAEFNNLYFFEDTKPEFLYTQWVPDYKELLMVEYNEEK